MKKLITIVFLSLVLIRHGNAQQPVVNKIKNALFQNQLSAGPSIALGKFSDTHLGGITVSYIRKQKKHEKGESFHESKTYWLAAASLSHYLGKKESTGLITYRYKNYSMVELNGGLGWHVQKQLELLFRSGPALGYYNSSFRITVTGQFQSSYHIGTKKSITPGLAFVKEPGSDALWISSLQLAVHF